VSHLAAELLLELPDEPDVDLPEGLAQAVGHVDHHGLPVPNDIQLAANTTPPRHYAPPTAKQEAGAEDLERPDVAGGGGLHGGVDVEVLEVALELLVAILQIEESLQDIKRVTTPSPVRTGKRSCGNSRGEPLT
jgi:hypothetical protein